MKQCIICGNDNNNELEITSFFSDENGNDDVVESDYICKENKGCNS